jgi:hypothetical protein
MKHIILFTMALFLSGCSCKSSGIDLGTSEFRLTSETVIDSEEGPRILVAFPRGWQEPVIVFDEETGQWVSASLHEGN